MHKNNDTEKGLKVDRTRGNKCSIFERLEGNTIPKQVLLVCYCSYDKVMLLHASDLQVVPFFAVFSKLELKESMFEITVPEKMD